MTLELIQLLVLHNVCCFSEVNGVIYFVIMPYLYQNSLDRVVVRLVSRPLCMSYDILVMGKRPYSIYLIPSFKELFSVNFDIKLCSASDRFITLSNGFSALIYDRRYGYSSILACARFIKAIGNVVVTYCNGKIWLRGVNTVYRFKYVPNDVILGDRGILVCTNNGLYFVNSTVTKRIGSPCKGLIRLDSMLITFNNKELRVYRGKELSLTKKFNNEITKVRAYRDRIYILFNDGDFAVFKVLSVNSDLATTIVYVSSLLSAIYLIARRKT